MQHTKIEWCDFTINPVKGLCPMHCKTPDGYEYCYAAGERGLYKRFKWNPEIRFDEKVFWNICAHKNMKPSKIFIGSTMELFGDWIPSEWLSNIFAFCRVHSQHTFIFLTKQPQNLIKGSPFPKNCRVGVTATNAHMLIEAVHYLKNIEAGIKFLSIEPLLDWSQHRDLDWLIDLLKTINWVIIGSQTQPIRHPKKEWVDEIIEAGDKVSIPIFVKEPMASHYGINRKEFPNDI